MSKTAPTIVYQLVWNHRLGPCPGEHMLGEARVPHGPAPAWLQQLWSPGCGYIMRVLTPPSSPPKRWSAERKGRARRQALERRVTARAPLFAKDLINAELQRRPGYFAGLDAEAPAP